MTQAVVLAAAVAAVALVAGAADSQPRGAPPPPPGNYFETCRNVSTFGFGPDATMTAECRDRNGGWRQTSIRFAGCDRIENRNGQLSCRPSEGYIPPPPGPGYGDRGDRGDRDGRRGQASLTLFSTPDFGGQPFQTFSEITNLPKQYNDRAMSVRIDGRRAWQLCTDSDFRGHCQVFDHDVRDLRQFGMGGQISSMRPVR